MSKNTTSFIIRFSDDKYAPAMRIAPDGDPQTIVDTFGLLTPRPVIFISGGAGGMSDEDIEATRQIMEHGIAAFAHEHNITVVDGGTVAGVMEMIGNAREKNGYKFPLIGVCPSEKVRYPGSTIENPEAELHDGHSHFVLVESDEWGGESEMIAKLSRAIAQRQRPKIGVLINGGEIAKKDVYYATATGDDRIPMLVLQGSGRTADAIDEAFKTQRTDSAIMRAIIQQDLKWTHIDDGVEGVRTILSEHFGVTVTG